MSGQAGDTASSASEKPEGRKVVYTLATVRRMLPLVRRVVHDLQQARRSLTRLQPEKAQLDRQRRTLTWPARARRYQLRDEIGQLEQAREDAVAELEELLNVSVLDLDTGRVGFPTVINDRRAFFSWQPGDEAVLYWHFEGETTRRLIPVAWMSAVDARPVH